VVSAFLPLLNPARVQADAKTSATAAQTGQDSLVIHVSYLVVDGKKRTAVPLDHKLSVGDRLRIEVTPSRTGFLYLFSRGKDGKRERLWPPGTDMLAVRGGQVIAVPEQGSFRIEGGTGEDTIDLLFTVSPLADPFTAAGPQPGSQFRQIRLKGVKLDNQPVADPGSSFTADLDDRGVAILELKVVHR
jgi:hypothetical protein